MTDRMISRPTTNVNIGPETIYYLVCCMRIQISTNIYNYRNTNCRYTTFKPNIRVEFIKVGWLRVSGWSRTSIKYKIPMMSVTIKARQSMSFTTWRLVVTFLTESTHNIHCRCSSPACMPPVLISANCSFIFVVDSKRELPATISPEDEHRLQGTHITLLGRFICLQKWIKSACT